MDNKFQCPLCHSLARKTDKFDSEVFEIDCPRCGKYTLFGKSLTSSRLVTVTDEDKLILSSHLRELYESGNKNIVISLENFDEILKQAKASKPSSFSEKMFRLLRAIEKKLPSAGSTIRPYSGENKYYLMAMSYSKDDTELYYYVEECLEKMGYLKLFPEIKSWPTITGRPTSPEYRLTPEAWKYLEEYKLKDRTRSDKAFIAIKFDEEYESAYNVIKDAVEDAGYKPIRADKEHHSEYIMDWIINQIKEARFIVAELTSKNLGVYYEFGYAKALDIPIIACLKKNKGESDEEALKSVHFDLKQFPIIIYENADKNDLGKKVQNRIENLVGKRE